MKKNNIDSTSFSSDAVKTIVEIEGYFYHRYTNLDYVICDTVDYIFSIDST